MNTSTNDNECEIFQTLRVSDEADPIKDTEVKTHYLYSGISANSWLTPIGIYVKKTDPKKYIGRLNDECKKAIAERAKGHNGIVGRKHFELEKQVLTENDLIIGKTFSSSSGSELEGQNVNVSKRVGNVGFTGVKPFCGVSRPVTRGDLRRPKTVGRTTVDTLRPFTAPSALDREHSPENNLPSLLIRQFTKSVSQNVAEDDTKEVKTKRLRKGGSKSAPPQGKFVGFNSVNAMHEAYELKLKESLPVPAWVSGEGRSVGGQIPYLPRNPPGESGGAPGEGPRNRFEDGPSSRETQQSSLRPLMYNSEADLVRHSTGCPYRCKRCFRACLASDDYVQENNTNSHSRPNNKVAERRAILRQNKPAWRGEKSRASPTPPAVQRYNRTANVIRIIRKEVPLSAYAWTTGPSYPPYSRYDTLITRRISGQQSATSSTDSGGNNGEL